MSGDPSFLVTTGPLYPQTWGRIRMTRSIAWCAMSAWCAINYVIGDHFISADFCAADSSGGTERAVSMCENAATRRGGTASVYVSPAFRERTLRLERRSLTRPGRLLRAAPEIAVEIEAA